MGTPEDVQEARRLTMAALDLQTEDVEYITEELLAEYEASGANDEETLVDENGAELGPEAITCRPVAYGNSLMFRPGVVWYRNGNPGPGYACGQVIRRWNARQGDEFTPVARCSSGRYFYRLCRPSF